MGSLALENSCSGNFSKFVQKIRGGSGTGGGTLMRDIEVSRNFNILAGNEHF